MKLIKNINPEYWNEKRQEELYKNINDSNKRIDDGVAGFVPVLGDVLQGTQAIVDASEGKWGNAVLGAGLLLLPNAIEKPLKTGAKQSIKYFKEIPINETAAYRVLKNDAINRNKAVKDAERLGLIRNFDKHRIPYYTYESIGDYTPNDNVIENLSRNFISVDPLDDYNFKSLSLQKEI